MAKIEEYKSMATALSAAVKKLNYQVAPKQPAGGSPKVKTYAREFRLQLINTTNDTSAALIDKLPGILKKMSGVTSVKFNPLSPNSSKFPSVEFKWGSEKIDVVIARGANKGENFEKSTVSNLASFFGSGVSDKSMALMIELMGKENTSFKNAEIVNVKQRTGSTKKEGVPIERLGAIIGDIVLTDSSNNQWFISLKDINGLTFSSYSGAASIFDSAGTLQSNSDGADFLKAFGVDLNQVQQGFDLRNQIKTIRPKLPSVSPNKGKLKQIFERAWGMNYFYVKRTSTGWKVFWIDRKKLDKLTDITVTDVKYPSEKSKQITISCKSPLYEYTVEIRNSKAGEYPNDIKFKVK